MSDFFKKKTYQKRLTGKRPLRRGLRLIGLICIFAMVLGTCCGCTFDDSTAENATTKIELEQEIEVLKAKNDAAQAELNTLKAWKQAAQEQIDALNGGSTASQQEINTLKATSQLLQQEMEALKTGNTASQQEIDALTAASQAAKKEIDMLKAGNTVLQQQIDELKAENEALQQEIEQIKEFLPKIRIYIDQGHNPTSYHNAGASGNGLYEQDVTFAIGCALAQLLEADWRFEICLSRPTESTVLGTDNASSLAARVQGAEDFGADYFISLHTNAYTEDTAHGIEVYTKDVDSRSYDFGSSLLQGLVDATGLRNRGMKTNPDLHVLKNTTMPAALLEMGFITNSNDAALLASDPLLFAQGIYNGILSYFNLTDVNTDTN